MPLTQLSDDEIIERCRQRWYEKLLASYLGCGASIFIGAVTSGLIAVLFKNYEDVALAKGPWWLAFASIRLLGFPGLLLWVFAISLSIFAMMALSTTKPEKYQREAFRRFIPASATVMESIVRHRAKDAQRPEWIIGFAGKGLPYGDYFAAIAQASSANPEVVTIEAWQLPEIDFDVDDLREAVEHVESRLPSEGAHELSQLTDALASSPLRSVPSFVVDGAPCTIFAVLPNSDVLQRGRYNLGDEVRGESQEPTVAIAQILNEKRFQLLYPERAKMIADEAKQRAQPDPTE